MTDTIFVVSATNRSTDQAATFLIRAPSHRAAWQVARETARTGKGAHYRNPHNTEELIEFPIEPSALTVTRVLSTERNRRGRPARILVNDLLSLAHDRDVKVPPRIRRVLEELHA